MEHVSDKGEALQRAHDGWAALWGLIDSMPPGQIDEPLGDGWSVKVHIAQECGVGAVHRRTPAQAASW